MLGGVGIDPFFYYKPLNSGVVEDRQNQRNQRIGGNMIENTDRSNLKVGDIVGHNSSEAIALITNVHKRHTTIKFLISGPFNGPVWTSYNLHKTWHKIT